jgi:outer membrane receptor protein involved in Fe transport
MIDVENLFDRKNVWWDQYRERPLTVAVGVEYRW